MKILYTFLICLITLPAFSQSRVISAKCGNCQRSVPLSSRAGQKCPYCGAFWGREDNSYSHQYVSPSSSHTYSAPIEPVIALDEYGDRKISIGFALLGEGGSWFGLPVRYFPKAGLAIDAGMYYAPSLYFDDYEQQLIMTGGSILSAGATFFGQKFYKKNKDKIKRNGFFTRVGCCFGQERKTLLNSGWASEGFRRRNKNQSFLFELGCNLAFRGQQFYDLDNRNRITLSAKFQWNLFAGSH